MEVLDGATTIEKVLLERGAMMGAPVNGSLELLPFCDMNCNFCYVHLTPEEAKAAGGRVHTGKEWLELGEQMKKAGTLFLLLTGGEPLLHPDFREIFIGLKKMGFILTLNTNGTLIDESWVRFFREYKPRRINITLYGADPDTYEKTCHYREGFERTTRAIQLLSEAGIDTKVGFSLGKDNAQDAGAVLQMIRKWNLPAGFDTYMLPAVRERGKAFQNQTRLGPEEAADVFVDNLEYLTDGEQVEEYIDRKLQEIKETDVSKREEGRMSCLAGKCSFSINWQGEMHPCVILTQPARSVFEDGFESAWKTIREGCDKIRLYDGCSVCRLRPVCRTCAACHLLESGSYKGKPEYMCRYARQIYRKFTEKQEAAGKHGQEEKK